MTGNNKERSRERDMEASRKMRLPDNQAPGCLNIRSFDTDATLLCDACGLPIFMAEWVRGLGEKQVRYTRNIAKKLKVDYYLFQHDGSKGCPTTVRNLVTNETILLNDDAAFKAWGEDRMREHNEVCVPEPNPTLGKGWNKMEEEG
jgi:hypothetical protein